MAEMVAIGDIAASFLADCFCSNVAPVWSLRPFDSQQALDEGFVAGGSFQTKMNSLTDTEHWE